MLILVVSPVLSSCQFVGSFCRKGSGKSLCITSHGIWYCTDLIISSVQTCLRLYLCELNSGVSCHICYCNYLLLSACGALVKFLSAFTWSGGTFSYKVPPSLSSWLCSVFSTCAIVWLPALPCKKYKLSHLLSDEVFCGCVTYVSLRKCSLQCRPYLIDLYFLICKAWIICYV